MTAPRRPQPAPPPRATAVPIWNGRDAGLLAFLLVCALLGDGLITIGLALIAAYFIGRTHGVRSTRLERTS